MQTIDLDKLPDFAQNELQDFYQFLLQKYATQATQTQTGSAPLAPRLVKSFEPLSREAVYER
ncbi:MAG: DUF2281 domain-containing protein [Methylobacter sp.]|nr:DUF2281 domain-containing protein [Methylobacter sp.]